MHNITERDGTFTVRQPAWHGLGAVLPEYPTREEAQAIAHPWEPITEPLYSARPTFHEHIDQCTDGCEKMEGEPVIEYEQAPGVVGVRRSDDGHFLGTVSDTYGVVKNSTMYDIAEALESSAGDVQYETGGSLKGGQKVWLLLRLREPLTIAGDPQGETIPYFALQNAHDGTASFRGQATLTRIVCDNTCQMADMDAHARGTEFTFRHSLNVGDRIEEAKQALAGWRESVREYRLITEHLVKEPVSTSQVDEFVQRFIPMPPPGTTTERVQRNVLEAQDQWRTCLESPTCVGVERTRYGLLQASVEYVEHYRRANSAESRFKRAYLDRSRVIQDAMAICREV